MKADIKKLKQISIFAPIKNNKKSLEEIIDIIEVRQYNQNEYIIREGDAGDEMFILSHGSVHIEKRTLEDESYTVVNLNADMHVFFGELALMDNDVRSASVIADNKCECYVIKASKFKALGNNNPAIGLHITREIAKKLSSRLRKANQDIITLFEALVNEIEQREVNV